MESVELDNMLARLDEALLYLGKKKRQAHDNDDVWWIRHHWTEHKKHLAQMLLDGTYCFAPVRSVEYKMGKFLHTFRTQDQLVLKAMALNLNDTLPKSYLCHSYKGHGGVSEALKRVNNHQGAYVLKTDVADYYASIDHVLLLDMLSPYVSASLLRLIYRALKCVNQYYVAREVGLPRGSGLSHTLGNFYLHQLDHTFHDRQETQRYVRYMDDILVQTMSKGALRRADKTIKQHFQRLKLNAAYHKSYIGKQANHEMIFLGRTL